MKADKKCDMILREMSMPFNFLKPKKNGYKQSGDKE